MVELTKEQIDAILKSLEMSLGGYRVIPYEEIYRNLAAASGTNTKDFTVVEPKRIRVITHIAALNATRSNTFIKLCHVSHGATAIDKVGVAPLTGETVNWDGFYILGGGDYAQVLWLVCSSGDDIYATIAGFEILL